MQISSGPLREVIINNNPFIVRSDLSTFQNSVFIGSETIDLTDETLTVRGGMRINGSIRAESNIVTNEIKVIGLTATDGVQIKNKEGSMLAQFNNNYQCILNGPTNIFGAFYCSHDIDGYMHTASEIRSRDNNGLIFGPNDNITSIKIMDNSDVEIYTPLKIKSSSTVIDNLLSVGIQQPTASVVGLTVYNSASIGGNLTVGGFISAKPYISLRVSTSLFSSGAISAIPSTTSTIGTAGAVTVFNYGYTTTVTTARGTAGASNAFLYTFSWSTPHPLGTNYAIGCSFHTGASSSPSPNAFITTNNTATSITVWIRSSDNILRDGNFYVYSIP
jgi:hypothetical protein